MNLSFYGWYFLPFIKKNFENNGHSVILNKFSSDVDVCICENIMHMYDIYIHLKKIKKNKIKFINIVADIPLHQLQKDFEGNTPIKDLKQCLFNISHKNKFLLDKVNYYKPNPKKSRISNFFSANIQNYLNSRYRNAFYHQINYRKFLKYSDIILSMSKFTQILLKKFLRLNSKVCYPCVNSDYLLNLPKVNNKYDAINISRITKIKRQEVFCKAANKLGLKILIIGRYADKSIKLNCPQVYIPDHKKVFRILNETAFYVDASEFEGFGMTPIEAAFLDKITIASNTYVHRDVLGDYPLYFKTNNVNDLVDKMRIVLEGGVQLNNKEIKEKYTIQAFKNRLIKYIELLF